MWDFVKKFIEENIDVIEQHKYTDLIVLWDYASAKASLGYTDSMFDQFVDVLKSSGIDIKASTTDFRHDRVKYHLNNIMSAYLPYAHAANNSWRKEMFTDQLVTSFGFTDEELIDICDEVAEELQLGITNTHYYLV